MTSTNSKQDMERIKPALHVRGNIVIESESTPKMGGYKPLGI